MIDGLAVAAAQNIAHAAAEWMLGNGRLIIEGRG